MICARCDEPIQADEPFEKVENFGASGGGDTSYRHARPCRRVQTQTSPSNRPGDPRFYARRRRW